MGYEHFTVQDLWRLMNGQASFAPFLTDNPWVRVRTMPDGVMWVTTRQGQSWRVAIDMFCERKLGISMPSQANSKR